MKRHLFIGLAIAAAALSACQHGPRQEDAYDFKPYIQNEQQALPQAYPDRVWAYPQGTTPQQIVSGWKRAGIVMNVYDQQGSTRVDVGPQFYNLPGSDQRGLANAIAQMYHADHFLLMDYYRKRAVGVYTPTGLQLY